MPGKPPNVHEFKYAPGVAACQDFVNLVTEVFMAKAGAQRVLDTIHRCLNDPIVELGL